MKFISRGLPGRCVARLPKLDPLLAGSTNLSLEIVLGRKLMHIFAQHEGDSGDSDGRAQLQHQVTLRTLHSPALP